MEKWQEIFHRQRINMERIRSDGYFPVDAFGPIITRIMEYLPFKDRIALEGTCKAWNFIGKDAGWKDVSTLSTKAEHWVYQESFYFKLRMRQLKLILSRLGNTVKTIEFGTEPENPISAFQLIMNKAKDTIKRVDLSQGVCVAEIVWNLERIPNLEALKLGSLPEELENCLKHVLEKLVSFSINYNFHSTGEFLTHLNPNLRELEIGGCPYIQGSKLMRYLSKAHDLERLDLYGTRDIKAAMISIGDQARPKLKHLTLNPWYEQAETDGDLKEIYTRMAKRLPNLESLKISRNEGIPKRTLIFMSQGYPHLTELDISQTNFSEHELSIAARYLFGIKTLILDKPHNLLSFKFLYQLKHLQKLQIRYLPVHQNLDNILVYAYHQETLKVLDLQDAMDLIRMTCFHHFNSRLYPLHIHLWGTDLSDLIYPLQRILLGKTILDFQR